MTTDSSSDRTYSDQTGAYNSPSSYDEPANSSTPEVVEDKPVKVVDPHARVTDRPAGATALVVLRIVVALIMAAHGAQKLRDMSGTQAFFEQAGIPSPDIMAQVTAWSEIAIAAALVIGLAVRLAGLGVAVIAIGALVTTKLQDGLFPEGAPGFAGELELLLAAAGVVLLLLGGGGWGADKFFRGFNKRGMAAIKS